MSFETPGDNVRCDHCNTPGIPYEYRGRTFSGLTACEGDRLCPGCRDAYLDRKSNEPVGWARVPARDYVSPIAANYRDPGYRRPKRRK